jgi:hypothetical protein
MSMFGLGELFGLEDNMARARAKKVDPADEKRIAEYVEQLTACKTDREAFEVVFAALKEDKRLKAADITAIAYRYNKGGAKPSSKAVAFAAISKRFVEIVRFHAKNKVAEKARPW